MKEKIKKIIFGYLPGFITGLIICGCVSVIAATYFPSKDTTYDNTASGLQSTNVQDAIDELYNTCFPAAIGGNGILDQVDTVTSGDGLYKDEYEDRYFYKGTNPNNYISFNEENDGKAAWRIISIEGDGRIKIVKINSIGNIAWNTSNNNVWYNGSLNIYLDGTYYNSLSSVAQRQIVDSNFSIGAITWNSNDLTALINEENTTKWSSKIALPTVSEYLRTNSNVSLCGTFSLNNTNYNTCKNFNWMYNQNMEWWTLSALSGGGTLPVTYITNTSTVSYSYSPNEPNFSIRPTIYLSSNVKITGGTGTASNPYTIS